MAKKLKKKDKEIKKKQQKLLKPASASKIKKKKSVSSRTPCAKFKGKSKMIRVNFMKKDQPNTPKKLSGSAITSVAISSSSSASPTKKVANKCGGRSSSVLEKSSIVKSGKAQVQRGRNRNTSRKSAVTSAKNLETPGKSQVSLEKGQGRFSENPAFLAKTGDADTSGEILDVSSGSATYVRDGKKNFKLSSIFSVMIPKPRCRSSLVQISQSSSNYDFEKNSVSNQAQKTAKNKAIKGQSRHITNSISEKKVDSDRTNKDGESDSSEFEDLIKNIESMPKKCSNQISTSIGSPNASSGSINNSEKVDFLKTTELEGETGTNNKNTRKHSKSECETISTLHSKWSRSQSLTAVNQEQNTPKELEASCRNTLDRLSKLEYATKADRLDGMKDNEIDRHLKRGCGRPRSRLSSPLQKNNGADGSKGQISNELSNDRRSRSRSRSSRNSLIKTGKEEQDSLESSQRQSRSISRLSSSRTEITPASSFSTHAKKCSNEDDLRDAVSERSTRRLRSISTTEEEQSRSQPPIPPIKNSRTSECIEERGLLAEIDESSELEEVFDERQNKSEENDNSICSVKLKQVNTLNLHSQKENKRVDQCPESANSCENITEIPSKRSTCLNIGIGPSLVPVNNCDQVSNSLGDLRDKLETDLNASNQKEKLSNECSFLSVEVPGLKQVGNSFNVLSQKRRDNESPSPVRIRVNTGSRLSRREEFYLKKQINHSFKAYVKLEPLCLDRGLLSVSCLSEASLDESIIAEFSSVAETKKKQNKNINNLNYDTSLPERTKLADDEALFSKCGTNNIEGKNGFQDLCVSEREECDLSSQISSPNPEGSKIGSRSVFPLSKSNNEVLLKSILTSFPRKRSKSVSFHPHLELFPEERALLLASSEVVDLSFDLGEEETSEPEMEDFKCLVEIEAICCSELEDSSRKIEKIKDVIKEAPKSAKHSKAFIVIGNSTELDLPSDIIVNVTHLILKNLLRVKENVKPNGSISKCETTEARVPLKDSNEHSESTVTVKVPREKLQNSTTTSSFHDSTPLPSPLKQRLWLHNIRSPEEKVTVFMNETPENVLLSQIETRLSRNSVANVCHDLPGSSLEGITPLSKCNLLHVDSNLNSPTGNAAFDYSAKPRATEEPGILTKREIEATKKLRIKAPSRVEAKSFSETEDRGIEKKAVTPQEPLIHTIKEVATKQKEPLKLESPRGLVINEGKKLFDRKFYLQILRKIQSKKPNSKSEYIITVEGKSDEATNKDKPCYTMYGPRKILDDSIPLESISLASLDEFDLSEKHKDMLLEKHKEWSILANADIALRSHEHPKDLQLDEKSERRKGSHERQAKSKDVLNKKIIIQESQEMQKKKYKSREMELKRKHETSDSQENNPKKEKTASRFLEEGPQKRDESCSNKRKHVKDADRKKSRSRDKEQKSNKKQRIIEMKVVKDRKGNVVTNTTKIFLSPERPKSGKELGKESQTKKVNSTDISGSPTISSPRTPDFTNYSENKSPALFLSPTKISQKMSPIVSKTALKIMHEKKLAEAERASKSESPTEVLSSFIDLAPLTVSGSQGYKDTLIIIPHPETVTPPKFQDLFLEHQSERVDNSLKGERTGAKIVLKMTDIVSKQATAAIDIRDTTEFQEENSASLVVEDTKKVAAKDDGSMIAEAAGDVTLQDQPKTMLIDEVESNDDLPETCNDSNSDLNAAAPTRTSTEAVEYLATEINTEGQSTTSEDELLSSPKQLLGEEKEEIIAEGNICCKDAGKEITEEKATPRSDMVSTSVFDLAKEPEPEPLDYEIDLEHDEELLDVSDRQTLEEQRSTEAEEEQNNLSESPNNNTQVLVDKVPHESRKKICFSVLYYGTCKKQETCLYIHDLVNNEVLLEKLVIQNYSKFRVINCLKIWKASLEKGFLGQYNTYYSLVPMLNNRKLIDTKAFSCLLDHGLKLAKSHDKDGEELIWAMYLFLKERRYICKSLVTKIVRIAIEMKMVYILSDFLSSVLNPDDRVRLKPIFWQILLSLKDYFGCSELSEVVSAISKINVQLLDFFATDVSIEKQYVLLTALLSRSRPSAGPPLPVQHLILELRNCLPESLVSESSEKINKPRVAPELLFIPPNARNTQSHGKSAACNPDVFEDVRSTDWERKVLNRQEQPIMPLNMLQRQQLASKGCVNPQLQGYSAPNWLKKQYEACSDNNAETGPSFENRGGFSSKRRKFDHVDTQAVAIETTSVGHRSSLHRKPFINSPANVLEENGYIKNLEVMRNKAKIRSDYSKFKLDDSELEMLNSRSVVPRPVAPVRPFPPRDLSLGRPYLLETPSAPPLYAVDHMNPPMKNIQSSTGGTVGLLQDLAGTSNLNSREMEDIPPSTLGQDTTVQARSSHFVFGHQIPKGFAFVRINNNRKPLGFSTDPDLNVGSVTESVSEIAPTHTVDRLHPEEIPLRFSPELLDSRTPYPAIDSARPGPSVAVPEPGPSIPNGVPCQRVNTLKDVQLGKDLSRPDSRTKVDEKQISWFDTTGDTNAPCQIKKDNVTVRKLFASVFGKSGENTPNFCDPEDAVTNRAMKTLHYKVVADRISRDPDNTRAISAIVRGLCVFKLNAQGLSSILEELTEKVVKSPGIQKLCVAFTLELCRHKRYEELFKTCLLFKKHTIIYLSPDLMSPIHPSIEPHDILIELALGLVRKGEWRHAISILDKKMNQTRYMEKLIDNDRLKLLSQIIIKKVQETSEAPLVKARDLKSEIHQILLSHESATYVFVTTLRLNSTDVTSLKDQLAPKFDVLRLFLSRKGDSKIMLWRR